MNDLSFMRHALSLARRNLGRTWPNPAVGCVLVQNGRILGRGWTAQGGRPHAETEALAQAGDTRGATAYVTLEPCAHLGQTGPCTEALIEAGIARAVIACEDPDPRTSGKGVARLRQAGIAVETGLLAEEAAALNQGFFLRVTRQRPLVTLKLATSLDGHMALAGGESQWITGEAARVRAHNLRAEHDAILTGIGTIQHDNPRLTCRLPGREDASPLRIVVDSKLRIPPQATVIAQAGQHPLWLIHNAEAHPRAFLQAEGIRLFSMKQKEGRVSLKEMLALLAEQGLTRLLVEAGPTLSTAFLQAGLVDRLYWFRAPKLLGADSRSAVQPLGLASLAKAPIFRRVALEELGPDVLEIFECSPE